MPLNVTPGDASAQSYASVAEFKTYRTNRLPKVTAVLNAGDADITAALIVAARTLDNCFDWTGAAVDAVQGLCWPRKGMNTRNKFPIGTTTIPQELKNAQCELAYQMLAGSDLTGDNEALKKGVSSVSAGSVSVSFQSQNTSSIEAVDLAIRRMQSEFNYVSDSIPGEVRRLLVPSWFNQPRMTPPLTFLVS